MNGTNATQHRTIPRHHHIIPYNRNKIQSELETEIQTAIAQLPTEPHKMTFCAGLEVCAYVTENCMYGMKKCYFE